MYSTTQGLEKVAPPGSYIHVKDFKSPKQLAEYLKELDRNDTKYMEYFKWKTNYEISNNLDPQCQFCEYLLQPHEPKIVEPNAWDYYFNKSICQGPKFGGVEYYVATKPTRWGIYLKS